VSTLAFAAMTEWRKNSPKAATLAVGEGGISPYVDAVLAVVPAETLALHAVILSVTTRTVNTTTQITARGTLFWAFFGLIVLSGVLYAVPRVVARDWEVLDYVRMLIPPLGFVGWTMLQRATAFDAVFPNVGEAPRTVMALFLAVILCLVFVGLRYRMPKSVLKTRSA
jgi:hypothetical protein